MKAIFFHIPKTAGSSINKFFGGHVEKSQFHIEGIVDLDKTKCDKFDFISGHVPFNRMDKILPLENWVTLTTFREPISYVVSHLKWVRKLADAGEEKRFNAHPKPFQRIALKMKDVDFSDPQKVRMFVEWLEKEELLFLHNTQTYFMNSANNRSDLGEKQVNIALDNIDKINFVGIQEELDAFLYILAKYFGWKFSTSPFVNKNDRNYGLDHSNVQVMNALLPLYEKDLIVYEYATKNFNMLKKHYPSMYNK